MATPYPPPLVPPAWLPGPDQVLGWLRHGAGWSLAQVPPSLGFLGYMALMIWLTRWVARHVRPVPLNPAHPMFRQPGGVLPWFCVSGFRLLVIAAVAMCGFALPQALANAVWRPPYSFGDAPLGALGRLSEVVGLVCGAVIGYVCQYQLNVLFVVGMIGYGLWSVMHWVMGR